MVEYSIAGVAIIPLVIGIVEFLKSTTGLQGNLCRVVGFLLAGGLSVLAYLMKENIIPVEYQWVPIVLVIFLGGGLAASGMYDFVKRAALGFPARVPKKLPKTASEMDLPF